MKNFLIISRPFTPARRIATELKNLHHTIDVRIVPPKKIVGTNYGEKSITISKGRKAEPRKLDPKIINSFMPYCKSGISQYLQSVHNVSTFNYYTNVMTASDKWLMSMRLQEKDLPVAKEILISHRTNLDNAVKKLGGFPVVCKRRLGSQGKGVFLVNDEESLIDLMSNINDKTYLLQEFVNTAKEEGVPYDYRMFMVNGKCVACMKRLASKDDFRANLTLHKVAIAMNPNDEMKRLARQAVKASRLEICGVDIAFDRKKEKYIIIEVNSCPGLGIEKITGINVAKHIAEFINDASMKKQSAELPDWLPTFERKKFTKVDITPEEVNEFALKHYTKGATHFFTSIDDDSHVDDIDVDGDYVDDNVDRENVTIGHLDESEFRKRDQIDKDGQPLNKNTSYDEIMKNDPLMAKANALYKKRKK